MPVEQSLKGKELQILSQMTDFYPSAYITDESIKLSNFVLRYGPSVSAAARPGRQRAAERRRLGERGRGRGGSGREGPGVTSAMPLLQSCGGAVYLPLPEHRPCPGTALCTYRYFGFHGIQCAMAKKGCCSRGWLWVDPTQR